MPDTPSRAVNTRFQYAFTRVLYASLCGTIVAVHGTGLAYILVKA